MQNNNPYPISDAVADLLMLMERIRCLQDRAETFQIIIDHYPPDKFVVRMGVVVHGRPQLGSEIITIHQTEEERHRRYHRVLTLFQHYEHSDYDPTCPPTLPTTHPSPAHSSQESEA